MRDSVAAMKRFAELTVAFFAVFVFGATTSAQNKAGNDAFEKLRAGYAKHMTEIMAPVHSFLKDELKALEKRMIDLGDLDMVVAVRDARIQIGLESVKEGSYAKFSIDVRAFVKQHGQKAQPVVDLHKRYIAMVKSVWLPAQKKYIAALDTLEARYVKASDQKGAGAVRAERQRIRLAMFRPGILENIPDGAVQFQGNFYWRFEQKMSWPEAKKACEDVGGHLVTISSEEENEVVTKLAGKKDCWLGFSDVAEEGVFVWVTGEPFEYQAWAPEEPNGGTSQNWGEYYRWGDGWDDRASAEIRFICEWEVPKR